MKNISFRGKILTIVIGTIIVITSIVLVNSIINIKKLSKSTIEQYRNEAYQIKKDELKNYVAIAMKVVESYYERSGNDKTSQMKKEALETISQIRYGTDGYFWINDSNPKMIMHPIKPELFGKDLSENQDAKGEKHFIEMVKVANASKEGGLVQYSWNRPNNIGTPREKFSYVQRFEPWDWIIGTGEYVDNIEEKVLLMQEDANKQIGMIILQVILIATIVSLLIGLIISKLSTKYILKPLNDFQNGLMAFFSYLNKETNKVELIGIDSKDELGTMSKIVNTNITKTQILITQDNELIDDVKRVVAQIKNGHLNINVQNNTQNESLQELRNTFNEMLAILNQKIGSDLNNISKVLGDFAKHDFTTKVPSAKGQIEVSINNLGDEISSLLKQSLTVGKTLEQSSNRLIENVDTLNKSSNEAAANLEETAAALEEITSTISNNTNNISQMSTYSHKVSISAKKGQELARNTTIAMDEITSQVTLINEAIAVIDQIAFQTNILSLNAAVEAATAGEAGKGFSVVAGEVRNLATRSAEAAKEIKGIVERATSKANEGKDISNEMIKGYDELLVNITKTTDMIGEISNASKEQEAGIVQINDAVSTLDQQTQANAAIASQTQDIAFQTDTIAKEIVSDAMKKEFIGKDSINLK
ncbi:MAG: cache domain-containing protein [Arcobacteraceae bacterium]|nr:cache domain-containing protein [Arcobacteraceae bacterium]